jgi:metal-sulfur cluster biosynthetic enzyme
MTNPPLEDTAVLERLRLLEDPEIGLNIVDLGMVRSVTHDEKGNVSVVITPTTPNCPMHDQIVEGARLIVETVAGVMSADIIVSFDPPWTPELITEAGRAFLNDRG